MKNFLSFIIVCLFLPTSFTLAQSEEKMDSLLQLLDILPEDTNKAIVLKDVSEALIEKDASIAKDYAVKSIELSDKLGFLKGSFLGKLELGKAERLLGDLKEANSVYVEALRQLEKIPFSDQEQYEGTIYNFLGLVNWNIGNAQIALEYYFKSRELLEKAENPLSLAKVFNNIGLIYQDQDDHKNAIRYFKESLKIADKADNKFGQGLLHNNIGYSQYLQEDYDKALASLQKALSIREELGNKAGLASTWGNLAYLYEKTGKLKEASDAYNRSLSLCQEIGHQTEIAESYIDLGDFHLNQKRVLSAIEQYQQAAVILEKFPIPKLQQDMYLGLSKAYSLQGDYQNAYHYSKSFQSLEDSLRNSQNVKKLVQLEMQLAFDRMQEQNELEKAKAALKYQKEIDKQTLITSLSIVGLLAVLIISFLLYRSFKQKQSDNLKLEAKNIQIEEEREKSDKLLLNILPLQTAKELKNTGKATPKAYESATVLFTDFVGFTQVSEKMSPSELVSKLDEIFQAFDDIITKHGLEKIKTIGDAYMCVGGLPEPNQQHPVSAVKAGLEMQSYLKAHPSLSEWKLRCGIHSGPLTAGVVGKQKFAYDIWGDTVNLAARMESSGEAGKVNISQETYELVKEDFICEHRGKVKAKNKGEVDMYFIIEEKNL